MALSYQLVFAKDERVLCFHHDLLWEAKILDSKLSVPEYTSVRHYLVHYKGWKNTYDEWVPHDRLRKLNEANQQLAEKLKTDIELRHRAAPKGSSKKKAASSDLDSTHDSEEGTSSVSAKARGQKQGGDSEFEKVGDVSSPTRPSVYSDDSPLGPSPASSPGLPGFPKVIQRNKAKHNRSPPNFSWESDSPPAKRRRVSPASENGASSSSSSPPSSPHASASQSTADHSIPVSFLRGSTLHHSPPPRSQPPTRSSSPLTTSPPATLPSPAEDILGSSSLSSAPSSPRSEKVESGKTRRGRSSGKKTTRQGTHEIFGDAVLGSKFPSRNDPMGIHGSHRDYPCGRLDNLMHERREYPPLAENPYAQPHPAIRNAPRANAAKRLFYEGQAASGRVMVAGKPLEQKEAKGSSRADSKPPGRKPRASKKRGPPKVKGKAKVDGSPVQEEAIHAESSTIIEFPDHLKSLLVDDWENVTSKLTLVPLPSLHPANEILTAYFDEAKGLRASGSPEADLLEEVVSGMKEYFEKALGRVLLYRFEREQYFQTRQSMEQGSGEWQGKTIGDIYGPEHLCRLLVSMPQFVDETTMDQESRTKFLAEIDLLVRWLGRNFARYFVSDYETPTAEYIVRARGN